MTAQATESTEVTGRLGYPWWLVLLEGIAALIVGILLLTDTGITWSVIVVFLGVWWLIGGIFALISMFVGDDETKWYWKLLKGIVGILAGLLVIQHPLASTLVVATAVPIVVGIMGIIYGAVAVYQAFKGAGWGVGILGAISVILGLWLIVNPVIAGLAVPIVLGIFLIVGGVIALWQSFQVRKLQKQGV
jgi:uncharacterized membrane protein HdeD (DUF308 family)